MRKWFILSLFAFLCFAPGAQELKSGASAETEPQTLSSGHYTLSYPAHFPAAAAANRFNACWNAFNDVFRFDPSAREPANRVVILADKAAFDAYIQDLLGETRNDCLFLKYPRREQSCLVVYVGENGSIAGTGPALNRQLFLQYLYSFVAEPPLWIRDGFQARFEQLVYDESTGKASLAGTPAWLEAAKNLHADTSKKLDVSAILSGVTGSIDSARLYPQAWAFSSWLLESGNPDAARFFHEACVLLEGATPYNLATQQQNTDGVRSRFLRSIRAEDADKDFSAWLAARKSFSDLLQEGVTLYNGGKYGEARPALLAANDARPSDPLPSYYLGLISWAEKDYQAADSWYLKALGAGGESATIHWALGLSALADKRYADARSRLEAARAANPGRYGARADRLLSSLPK